MDKKNYSGIPIIILIIVVIFLWYQNSSLQKKVDAYQEESDTHQEQIGKYAECIDEYTSHEKDLMSAIDDATGYLEEGGSDNYVSAEDALDVDTSETNCDIPASP